MLQERARYRFLHYPHLSRFPASCRQDRLARVKVSQTAFRHRPVVDGHDSATKIYPKSSFDFPIGQDSTFRLSPDAGDYLLRIRCRDPWCNPPQFAITDFWEFRERDHLLITNREEHYPAPVEQMEEEGPNLWKAMPGDRLAWVGWRLGSTEREPTLIALINCLFAGYVYGEPAVPTVESVLSFGAASSELSAEVPRLWKVGYDAAVALGLPRNWQSSE